MFVSELTPSAINQTISLHTDSPVSAHQPGRHVGFPDAVHEVLTSLRTLTGIPNWALTRQRSDGSLTILSPARRPQSSRTTVANSESNTASFLTGKSANDTTATVPGTTTGSGGADSASQANGANLSNNLSASREAHEPIEPVSTRAFVLDRRKHLPVFLVDILDEARDNTFGSLVGYRTGQHLRNENPIAPADANLAGLLASMLASVLAQDRRTQLELRAEERIAYPERDPITGCLERSAWMRLLESEALRLHRFDDEALMIAVRIEDLTTIKRTQGIEAAEELRREISYALHSTTTSASLVAHLDDDTFASLLCSTDPTAELRAFRSRIELLNLPVQVTVGQRLPGERSLHSAQRRAGLV